MIAPERLKRSLPRSGVLFGSGVRLALTGSILVVMYFFLVAQSPLQDLRETLRWAVPAGVICWIVAVGFFGAGLVVWNSENTEETPFALVQPELSRKNETESVGFLQDSLSGLILSIQKKFPSALHLEWSLPLLRSLDAKTFRNLGASFFQQIGYRPILTPQLGPKGIDIWLYGEGEGPAVGVVRCLPWGGDVIGLRQVEDFYRVMAIEDISNGVLLATGTFSEEAHAFSLGKKLELISGYGFLAKVAELPAEKSGQLLRHAAKGE